MNRAFVRALLLSLLALPSACWAGWVYNLSPGSIRVMGPTGDVTFAPTNVAVGAYCGSTDFYIVRAANNAKMALSILLAAKALNKNVNIYLDDAAVCDGLTGRPAFTHILLTD